MIIQGKIVHVFDIEVFPNVFSCTVKNTESGHVVVFEISSRTEHCGMEALSMVNMFLNKHFLFCGYNNIHYDNPIINFFIKNIKTMPADYRRICDTIYKLSQKIVNSESTEGWKELKYANNFATLDLLTMLFSQKLRVGLKEMQVTMQYHNVQEYEGDFDTWLPEEEIDKMLSYNLNDVESTEELLNRCKADIDLRIGIQEEFGVDVLSKDGMTIGQEILKVKYLEKSGKKWWEIKDLRSPCDVIDLNEVIFPFIKYDTPVLQNLLTEMKQQKVSAGRKGYEKHFLLDGVEVTVGVGGIHTKNEPEKIIPGENELLLDSDVNSLYPSLIISYGLVPKHLGKEFLDIYGQVREDRLYAKRNKMEVKNQTYKLALNGATGNYQNEYSWLYDPVAVMKIRINGQLLLLMLTEMLLKAGARLKQLNTDGILYLIPKSVDYQTILKEWEDITKLTLETEEYEAFYQYAINDYLAIGKGYSETKNKKLIKQKGLFIDKVKLGKGMQPMIIPEALNKYFADGIPVEQTIMECRDINKFITYQKADKKFSVEYNGELISRINRYYCSTNGCRLYKCVCLSKDEKLPAVILHFNDGKTMKVAKSETESGGNYWYNPEIAEIEPTNEFIMKKGERVNYNNMLKASGVTIVNNLDEVTEFPDNVNYNYYIAECNKIISPFVHRHLSLFD